MTLNSTAPKNDPGLLERAKKQVDHELDLIARLGFAGYFLIVWDIVCFCKKMISLSERIGDYAGTGRLTDKKRACQYLIPEPGSSPSTVVARFLRYGSSLSVVVHRDPVRTAIAAVLHLVKAGRTEDRMTSRADCGRIRVPLIEPTHPGQRIL